MVTVYSFTSLLQQKYSKFLLCSRLISLREEASTGSNDNDDNSADKESDEGIGDNGETNGDEREEEDNSERGLSPQQQQNYNTSPHGKLEYKHGLEGESERALEQVVAV